MLTLEFYAKYEEHIPTNKLMEFKKDIIDLYVKAYGDGESSEIIKQLGKEK